MNLASDLLAVISFSAGFLESRLRVLSVGLLRALLSVGSILSSSQATMAFSGEVSYENFERCQASWDVGWVIMTIFS